MKNLLKKINLLLTLVILAVLSISCASTSDLTIEIPQRGKKELPTSIQSLTIISRTLDNEYTDLESDSLQNIFYKNNFRTDTIIKDIQAVDTTIKALGELLYESGRYDFVIPEERLMNAERNAFLSIELTQEEVQKLCEDYNTDAVLSLDHFKTQVITDYRKENFFDPASNGFSSASYADMKIYYEALFRIYHPSSQIVLVREFMRDTVMWEDADLQTGALFKRFTPVKTALSEAGIAIALDFSDKITTTWVESSRVFYGKGDDDLKHGAILVDNGEWQAAMSLWKDLAEKTQSKSVKSKAEFNVALAYELQGDINEAIRWGLKSYDTMFRQLTYNYLDLLKRRRTALKNQQR